MGQQQLLLLVLGIVIVGLAVVTGIQVFSENQKKANADALMFTALRIASDAQAWLQTPEMFGGAVPASGVRPTDFSGNPVNFEKLAYPLPDLSDDEKYATLDGVFKLDHPGGTLLIEATSASSSGGGDNNLVCVYVLGTRLSDIITRVNPTSGACNGPNA